MNTDPEIDLSGSSEPLSLTGVFIARGLVEQHVRQYVSYSDGEGSDAGVGVAIWGGSLEVPLAASLQIPREIRLLWSKQRENSSQHALRSMFDIEAVGPVTVLVTWPRQLRGCLWVHFIDNDVSQAALINGSSSVLSGDIIASITWEMIAKQRIFQ